MKKLLPMEGTLRTDASRENCPVNEYFPSSCGHSRRRWRVRGPVKEKRLLCSETEREELGSGSGVVTRQQFQANNDR